MNADLGWRSSESTLSRSPPLTIMDSMQRFTMKLRRWIVGVVPARGPAPALRAGAGQGGRTEAETSLPGEYAESWDNPTVLAPTLEASSQRRGLPAGSPLRGESMQRVGFDPVHEVQWRINVQSSAQRFDSRGRGTDLSSQALPILECTWYQSFTARYQGRDVSALIHSGVALLLAGPKSRSAGQSLQAADGFCAQIAQPLTGPAREPSGKSCDPILASEQHSDSVCIDRGGGIAADDFRGSAGPWCSPRAHKAAPSYCSLAPVAPAGSGGRYRRPQKG